MTSSNNGKPVVEPKPDDDEPSDLTSRALRQRIRQQELLAELGVLALQGTSFIDMLNLTARMTAEGLGAEYCKVLQYIPAENRFLVRAGVGWDAGVIGTASVGADLASPAGCLVIRLMRSSRRARPARFVNWCSSPKLAASWLSVTVTLAAIS
jgi:hypothetical protein